MNHSDTDCLSQDTMNNYYQAICMTKDNWVKYKEFSQMHAKTINDYKKIKLPEKGLPLSPIKKKTQDMLKQYSQSLELFSKSIETSLLLMNLKYNTLFMKYAKLLSTLQNDQGCILSELRVISSPAASPSPSTSSLHNNIISIYDEGSVSAKDHRESLKPYHFDYCFSPSHSQLSIFQFNEPVLNSVVDGYKICMLLYGSSETDKLYTLNGSSNDDNKSNFGIIQMTVEYLMNYKDSCKDKSFEICLSVYEMMNDDLYDLQSPKHSKITISESSNYIQLTGNESKPLDHITDFISTYKTAMSSSTSNSNDSHKIILIKIKRVTEIGIKVTGKLVFVALANSDSKNKYIASSLQSIKDVLRALKNKEKFVPHRSNKITLLLKEYLNSDSKLIMLFHIQNTTTNETIATLNYASLATPMELSIPKKYIEIEANSVTNKKLSDEISSLKSEIKRLNEELKRSKSELQAKEIDISNADATIKSLKYQIEMKNSVFTDTKTDKENIDKKMFELKKTNEKLNEEIKNLEQKVNSMKYKEQIYKQKIEVLSNEKSRRGSTSSSSSNLLSGDSKYQSESKALKELQMKYDKLERKYTKVELQLVQLTDNADLKTPDVTPRPTPKSTQRKAFKKSSLSSAVTMAGDDSPTASTTSNISSSKKEKSSSSSAVYKNSPQVSSNKKKLSNDGNKKNIFDFSSKKNSFQRSTSLNFSNSTNSSTATAGGNGGVEVKSSKTKTTKKSKLKSNFMERSLSDDNMLIFPPAPPEVEDNNNSNNNNDNNNKKKKKEGEDGELLPPQLSFGEEENGNTKTKEKETKGKKKSKMTLKTPPVVNRKLNKLKKPNSGDSSPVSDSATPDTSPFPFLNRKSPNSNDIVNLLQNPNTKKNNSKSVYDNIFSLSPDSVSEDEEDKHLKMYVSPITSPDYSDLEDNDTETCDSANSNTSNSNSNNNNNNNNSNTSSSNNTHSNNSGGNMNIFTALSDKSEYKKDTPSSSRSTNSRPPRYNGSNSSNKSGTNSPLNGSDAFFSGLESPISLTRTLYNKLHKVEFDNVNNSNNNNNYTDGDTGRKMSGEEAFFDGLVTMTPREKKEKKYATKIQSWYRGLIQRRKYMDMLFDLKHGDDF